MIEIEVFWDEIKGVKAVGEYLNQTGIREDKRRGCCSPNSGSSSLARAAGQTELLCFETRDVKAVGEHLANTETRETTNERSVTFPTRGVVD